MNSMPRLRHPLHTFGIAMLLAGTAQAQSPWERPERALELLAQAMSGEMPGPGTLSFADGELGQERVVKGAPYCADAVHETVQFLPDASGTAGNRIVQRQNTRLCRDGEGRTRQETERNGRRVVYLRDPVSRENWVLDPERKTARRLGSMSHMEFGVGAAVDSAAWREYAERMRAWAQQFARSMTGRGESAAVPPTPPAPPAPPAPSALPMPPAPAVISRHEGGPREIEFRILRADGPGHGPAALAPLPEMPPPPTIRWRAQTLAPRGAGVDTPLGSKDIEGVRANGERTTWTIEAGKIGNEKPIQIVREVWTSPDLMLTLSTRDFDPRSGETLYRVQNLRRGEPDPALMKVPADYGSTRSPARPASTAKG